MIFGPNEWLLTFLVIVVVFLFFFKRGEMGDAIQDIFRGFGRARREVKMGKLEAEKDYEELKEEMEEE